VDASSTSRSETFRVDIAQQIVHGLGSDNRESSHCEFMAKLGTMTLTVEAAFTSFSLVMRAPMTSANLAIA
jgi:hypothetical protein